MKKKVPNDAAIKSEIAALQKIKPTVLHFSRFGDDHHAAIDAQIEVLRNRTSIYDVDDSLPDNARSAACDAANWLAGDFEDAPSLAASWQELVRN